MGLMGSDMLARTLIVTALAIPAGAVVAEEQILHCQGEGQSSNLETAQRSDPVVEEQELKIRRDAGKIYLALTNGAFIEAAAEGDTLSYADVPNMIGTRSLSFDLSSGAMRYEAVATRHGKAIASFQFTGTCSEHVKP
jgi:hypothetical protein